MNQKKAAFLEFRKKQVSDDVQEPKQAVTTFARMTRRGAAWEVLAVDLPEELVTQYERVAAELDLYPNQERKLLIEARKTDFEKWK